MHLAIDAIGAKYGGVATVLLDTLHAALCNQHIEKITLFCSPSYVRRFDLPRHNKLVVIEKPREEASLLIRVIWHEAGLAHACKLLGVDIILCLANTGRGTKKIPHIQFIQQSLPFSKEALNKLSWKMRIRQLAVRIMMRRSSQNAARVVVQTAVMAEWVKKAFSGTKNKIDIVVPNVNPNIISETVESSPLQAYNVPTEWRLLYVGSDEAYKCLPNIIQGMSILRSEAPNATLFLTLPVDHHFNNVSEGIICLGYLAPPVLEQVYRFSGILVMPSLVETVGLPLLEAMLFELPILAADRPYAHFICDESAVYFDPENAADFAKQASNLLNNPVLRSELARRGKERLAGYASLNPYDKIIDIVVNIGQDRGKVRLPA